MKKVYLNTLTLEEIIKRLKNGEVITTPGSNEIKLVDGILVRIYPDTGSFTVGTGMDVVDTVVDNYFEEQEVFKIEKTGRYKTRDGRIAYVAVVNDDYSYGMICGDAGSKMWENDGKWASTEDTKNDLVEYVGD